MRNLIVRTITGVLYVAIMVLCFRNALSMVFVFSVIAALSTWEYCNLINQRGAVGDDTASEAVRRGATVNRFICTAASVFLTIAMFGFCSGLTSAVVFIPYLITIVYLLIAELFLQHPDPIANWAHAMLSQMYIALPLATINILAFSSGTYYYLLPLCVFVFLWCNDTGAYLSGSLLGKHKLFPRVSPGKSWEGSAGGAIIVLAVAALVWAIEPGHASGLNLGQWLGLGLVVVVFGTLGDLIESLFKRTLGIKDSGTILPGHGGMLDRFDSSLLAIPAVVIYIYSLSAF